MKTINHIFEPNPLACGQAAIAMAAGVDVGEVIDFLGTDRETALADMRKGLKHFGLKLSSERTQVTAAANLPDFALLSLETPKCWHWSLYADGVFYDPEYGVLNDFPPSNRRYYWKIEKI